MLDLRLPIGWYFVINSALLVLAGLFSGDLSMVPWDKGTINLNLVWAAVMAVFGFFMIGLSWLEKRSALRMDKKLNSQNAAAEMSEERGASAHSKEPRARKKAAAALK